MPREETIQIKIDKSAAVKSISELKKEAAELQKAFGSIKVADSVKTITDQAKASKEAANAAKAQASAVKELANSEKALENATKAKLQAKQAAQRVATEEARTAKEQANALKAQANAIKAADQAQKQLNKTVSSGASFAKSMGSTLISYTKQIIGFAGVTNVLRSALREMKSMNDELVTYRKVTGASAADMEKMRSAAYKAAQNYGQSPSDFLAGAATMARAGYGAASGQMAELATKTQLVGDMTADAASKFLIAVDAAYHYQGSITQLTKVLDGINEVDNNYATSIEKISEGMTLVASLASSAHVPIEELTAALGTMTAVTQRSGTETARGLRQIFLNIMGDTTTEVEEGVKVTEEEMSAMTKALQKYAPEVVKAAKATGKLINPMEAIGALAKQYKEGFLTEQDLFKITEAIGGKRYYNVFTALIQNYDMYEGMLTKVKNSAGSADKEVAAMMDSWSKKLEKLKSTWTELVNNTISENFIKSLLDAGTGALKFAGNLENLAMMAGSAYAAIKLLSSGIANVQKQKKFGAFNAWGIGISAVVAAIGTVSALGDKAFSDSVAAAQQAAQATQEQAEKVKHLGELIKQYKQLASDGVIDTSELETVKTLQSEIKDIIGDQATNVDLVNGNIKDQIQLLGEAYKAYAKQAYASAQTNTANAGVSVMSAANNWKDRLTGAGFRYDYLDVNGVTEEIRKYIENELSYWADYKIGGWKNSVTEKEKAERWMANHKNNKQYFEIGLRGNETIDQLVDFYKKSKELQKIFAQTYSVDELANNNFYKDMTAGLDKMAPAMEAYITALEAEYGALANSILAQDDFSSKTFESEAALQQYIDRVAKANNLNDEQKKALEEVAKAYGDVKKAAEEAGKGGSNDSVKKKKDDWDKLQDSINAATEAKKNFDAEMQENKGSAAKSYAEAFKKYKEEVAAGRVNSTAFHASARMLLGDDAYFATGGSSAKIRARMAKKGGSGSVKDASDILFQTYKSKSTGKEMEGYGIYQLLKQTKGLDKIISGGQKALTDKNGNMVIPKLTDQQLGQISKQWGGISVDMLKSMLNAFDQYDKNGKNTSKKYDEDKKARDAAKKKAKADQDAADAAKNAGKANQDAADATKNQTDQQQENADKTKDATPNVDDLGSAAKDAAEALEETADKTGEDNGQGGGEPEKSELDKFNESLDKAKQTLEELQNTEIGAKISTELNSFITEIADLQANPNLIVDITNGQNNATTSTVVGQIAGSINALNGLAVNGKIPLEVAASYTGNLETALGTIIKNAQTVEDLDAIYVALEAQDYVTGEINDLLKEQYIAIVTADADTDEAEDDIKAAAEKKYPDAEVKVVIPNQEDAIENVQAVSEGPYDDADVKVDLDDKDAKAGIADLQKPGSKTIKVHYETPDGRTFGEVTGSSGTHHTDGLGTYDTEHATGTSYHPGGPALVNDGAGPELIVDKGRAFIAGGGKPSILNLSKGAKVFTASQTRDIFMRSGVPAFKEGVGDINTGRKDDFVVDSGKKDDKKKDTKKKTTNNKNTSKKSSKSSKSGEKDDSYNKLIDIIDYIMNRIGKALEEQFKIIDEQIANIDKQMAAVDDQIDALQKKREKQKQKDELADKKKAVTDANKDLKEAKSERVVRYLGTDGKWHWMADKKAVAKAQESADSAKKDLKEYKEELAYQKEVEKLENKKKGLDKKKTKLEDKKTGLQNEYDGLAKQLDDIKEGVNTPTGSVTALINKVLKNGTAQEKVGAKAIQKFLNTKLAGKSNYVDTIGRYGKGNIDLNKRKVLKNSDGTFSTEESFSTNIDGKEVLLPTIINGKRVSQKEAINHYLKTGEHLGKFSTVKEAQQYAKSLHKRQEWYYEGRKSSKKTTFGKNYVEALNAVKAATKGNPVMPGDSGVTLASLIAGGGGGSISGSLLSMLTTAVAGTKGTKTSAKNVTNNNGTTYILNGVKIDASAAKNKTVSQIMQNLKVYAAK